MLDLPVGSRTQERRSTDGAFLGKTSRVPTRGLKSRVCVCLKERQYETWC